MEEQGRPPGDGFCPSRAWLVSGQDAGPGRLGAGTPTRSLPRGNVPHPAGIRPGSQGPWGRVCGTGRSPCHAEDLAISRGPHLPAPLPYPQRQSAGEEVGTWGRDGVPDTVMCQVERIQAGVTHAHGRVHPWEVRPAPSLGGLEPGWAETPPPCPKAGDFDPAPLTLSTVLNQPRKGV